MRRLLIPLLALAWTGQADAACRPVRAESDVAGIRIADGASARRVLGAWRTPAWEGLPLDQERDAKGTDLDFPYLRLTSADGREEARLYRHYGQAVGDGFPEFEVRPADPGRPGPRRASVPAFVTERGVRLGMARADLVRLLGSCFKRERGEGGEALVVYRIEDEGHALLKRTGMPSYEARYAFREGRLAWFRIGFEYP